MLPDSTSAGIVVHLTKSLNTSSQQPPLPPCPAVCQTLRTSGPPLAPGPSNPIGPSSSVVSLTLLPSMSPSLLLPYSRLFCFSISPDTPPGISWFIMLLILLEDLQPQHVVGTSWDVTMGDLRGSFPVAPEYLHRGTWWSSWLEGWD